VSLLTFCNYFCAAEETLKSAIASENDTAAAAAGTSDRDEMCLLTPISAEGDDKSSSTTLSDNVVPKKHKGIRRGKRGMKRAKTAGSSGDDDDTKISKKAKHIPVSDVDIVME
jgi:hypothetical protein